MTMIDSITPDLLGRVQEKQSAREKAVLAKLVAVYELSCREAA